MWLLSAARAELKFFNDPEDVPHPGICILSHTWGETKDEQTFQEVNAIRKDCEATGDNPRDHVSEKIRKCCELAEQHGYEWVWIDTCCINKESSSELSEAINSMFRYYSLASVCYAYLADVPADCDPFKDISMPWSTSIFDFPRSIFYKSRWHTRGWTLQELIAPHNIVFFSQDWSFLGTKADLAKPLEEATRIPFSLLSGEATLSSFSIAQRMSWASTRQTSRKEDEAYCLFGIFDINMPTLYGEGGNAFYRLQEEIIRKSPDTTIFAWGLNLSPPQHRKNPSRSPLLSDSPGSFQSNVNITFGSGSALDRSKVVQKTSRPSKDPMSFTLTPHGVLAHVPSAVIEGEKLVDLNWRWRTRNPTAPVRNVYLVLASSENDEDSKTRWHIPQFGPSDTFGRLVVYSNDPIKADWKMEDLYIQARRNRPRNSPGTSFPCNASAKSPFHFRIPSQRDGIRVIESFNASIFPTENAPAVVDIAQSDSQFHLTFGVCTKHAREDALVTHWITACFGGYKECHTCQNGASHSCKEEHIGDEDSGNDYSVETTQRWEILSNQDVITCRFELHLRRHPWSKDTVIVDAIRNIMLQLSTKHPLSYALDPKTSRVLLHTDSPFPTDIAGPSVYEEEGSVYLGSAVLDFGGAVHPCRVVVQDKAVKVLVLKDDVEIQHYGYYYLLALDDERMHWLLWKPRGEDSNGHKPSVWDLFPVIGGLDGWDGEDKIFHAYARIEQRDGRISHTLGSFDPMAHAAVVSCNGKGTTVWHFLILCWRKEKQPSFPSKRARDIRAFTDDPPEQAANSASLSPEETSHPKRRRIN